MRRWFCQDHPAVIWFLPLIYFLCWDFWLEKKNPTQHLNNNVLIYLLLRAMVQMLFLVLSPLSYYLIRGLAVWSLSPSLSVWRCPRARHWTPKLPMNGEPEAMPWECKCVNDYCFWGRGAEGRVSLHQEVETWQAPFCWLNINYKTVIN